MLNQFAHAGHDHAETDAEKTVATVLDQPNHAAGNTLSAQSLYVGGAVVVVVVLVALFIAYKTGATSRAARKTKK